MIDWITPLRPCNHWLFHKAPEGKTVASGIDPCQLGQREGSILDAGLVPVEVAAAALGIEPKRLIGFILRNSLADPIGGWLDGMAVYGWSCKTLAEQLAAAATSGEVGK